MFLPALPLGGLGGWRVLEATAPRQQATFEKSPMIRREIEYFRDNIEKAGTVDELLKDRRLRGFVLRAFGLGEEIDKRAYVKKVIEGDPDDPSSFIGRMTEPRYKALTRALGYGSPDGPRVGLASFKEDVIARFKTMEFERAVGEVDDDMRLAMHFKREIAALANGANAERTGWFQVMGQKPLRDFLSTAMGMPKDIAKLDIDRQKDVFERRAQRLFGEKSVAAFTDPVTVDDAIRRFFLFRQMEAGPTFAAPGAGALALMQASGLGGEGARNLFLSRL
jgi:hypothetical protein